MSPKKEGGLSFFRWRLLLVFKGVFGFIWCMKGGNVVCVCVFLFWVDTWFDDDESGQISSTRPKKTQMVVFWKGNSPCFSGKLDGW